MNSLKFAVRTIRYNAEQGGEVIEHEVAIITLVNTISGERFPHPITHFLYKYYNRNSGSINTELAAANVIVPFLNYVIKKIDEMDRRFIDVDGLQDLRIEHADSFLSYCVSEKGNLNDTSNRKENYISEFYMYLWNQGVLKEKPPTILVTYKIKDEVKEHYKLDFTYKKTNEIFLHRKVKRKDLVPQSEESNVDRRIIRLHYIREILLVAKLEAQDIAFGIALEIFGGLRRGELLNLVRTAFVPQEGSTYGELGLVVKIRDRQQTLFPRIKNTSKLQVKRPRDQSFIIDPILNYLYKFHMEVVLSKVKNAKHPNALFYDSNGNPMTADTFDNRFTKLKSTYLGMLLNTKGRYQDYLDFSETKWRSHIGRGVFTNMCRDSGYNEKQTAVLRGDRSIKSMEKYFDIITATFNIRKALGLLSPSNSEILSSLNMPFYKANWKDVEKFAKGYGG